MPDIHHRLRGRSLATCYGIGSMSAVNVETECTSSSISQDRSIRVIAGVLVNRYQFMSSHRNIASLVRAITYKFDNRTY